MTKKLMILGCLLAAISSYACDPQETIERPPHKVTVVIDAFRAFATASYVLEQNPAIYYLATQSKVIAQLANTLDNPLLIGKAEKGTNLQYHIPNSPTRVSESKITGRPILHRTAAGARGILEVQDADIILAVGFGNAAATTRYIHTLSSPNVRIVPMGHEGTSPSLEDNLCAKYLKSLLKGQDFDLNEYKTDLKIGPGHYFFTLDQWQYPQEDFEACLMTERFPFAIQATIEGDFAKLRRCGELSQS